MENFYNSAGALLMKKFTSGSILSGLLVLAGCAGLDVGVGNLNNILSQGRSLLSSGSKIASVFEEIDEEEEYYMGRSVSAHILTKYPPYQNNTVNNYVQRVGAVVASYTSRPEIYGGYHFQILNTNEVNALAAPGGFIFITKGFLKLLPDEDSLAAVFAHELSHITLRHSIDSLDVDNLTAGLTEIGAQAASQAGNQYVRAATNAFGGSVTQVMDSLLVNGYSKTQEYSADEEALNVMKNAGYNPSALADVIAILEKESHTDSGGLFATHPDMKDRHEEVLDELDTYVKSTPEQVLRAQRFARYTRGVR